jgi:hypothetical protein
MVALTRLATGMCCRAPLSADACRKGTPFSYATGSQYGVNDNSFTVFGYNDFGVAVMEDEGTLADHTSGVAATDGECY